MMAEVPGFLSPRWGGIPRWRSFLLASAVAGVWALCQQMWECVHVRTYWSASLSNEKRLKELSLCKLVTTEMLVSRTSGILV